MNHFLPDDYQAIVFDNYIHERIKIEPMYFNSGFSSNDAVYGRKIILNRLLVALNDLPEHLGFLIWDVYRPRAVQAKLFLWMRGQIREKMPHLSDEENHLETQKYISQPSRVGDEYCPPHLSGGAIDLTLFARESGLPLEMGTLFDDCTDVAHRDYFQQKQELTPEEQVIGTRRQLLRSAMERAGFTSYEYEWWHFDIGNIFWSRATQQPAVFGPLFDDKEWP